MAGLLDMMDPRTAGLLSGAFAGLNASGPSPTPVSMGQILGRAGAAGMGAYQDATAQQLAQRRAEQAMKLQEQQMGLMGVQTQIAQQNALRQQQTLQTQAEALARETARREAVGGILGKVGTLKSGAPTVENAANPQYYTENDALAELRKSNYLTDAEQLVKAMPKMDVIGTGGGSLIGDLRTMKPGTFIQNTISPDKQASLNWERYQFGNLSRQQQEQLRNDRTRLGYEGARVGMEGERLFDETGLRGFGVPSGGFPMGGGSQMGGAPSPRSPVAPQTVHGMAADGAPMPAGSRPSPRPMLSAKQQRQLDYEKAKLGVEADSKRENSTKGLTEAIDEAEALLKKGPTGSFIGAGVDMAGRVIGQQAESARLAAQLKTVAGVLTSKMPRMEGPQSNIDVKLYQQMAGDVGNNTLPAATRLAALKELRRLHSKYADDNAVAPTPKPRRYNPNTGELE